MAPQTMEKTAVVASVGGRIFDSRNAHHQNNNDLYPINNGEI